MSYEQIQEQEIAENQTGLTLELSGLLNLNKSELRAKVKQGVQRVEDGEVMPEDALIYALKGKELYTELEKQIRPLAEEKSFGKGYAKFGCEFTERMNGVKYDFSNCNDPEYIQLKAIAESATSNLKEREEFLKSLTKSMTVVDDSTGEVSTIYPPIKSGKIGLSISIK